MNAIKTNRLIIRSPKIDDIQALLNIHNDIKTLQYNAMRKYSYTDMARDIEMDHDNIYCLELLNSNLVIGAIFVNPDHLRYRVNAVTVSYYLDSSYYRKGYMFEALNAVITLLFEQEIEVISARVFKENLASAGLLEKLGFQYEGCLRKGVSGYQNIIHDDLLYSILKDEVI